jgi:flagellar P-ring protein precursor FlgI
MTPLKAADGEVYAVAQGPILAGGFSAGGEAAEITQGVPTSGTMPGGARVEREIAFDFGAMDRIRLALRDPDFTTAQRIEQVINGATGGNAARMVDAGTVDVRVSASGMSSPAHLLARIEGMEVAASQQARVVIDQRSGTIVLGSNVRLSSVAVSQGGLTVRVEEKPQAAMPNPFSDAPPILLPRTGVGVDTGEDRRLALVNETATLADLVDGLNALGVGPRGMIDILKSIKRAGALHADLIVQ